MGTGALLELVSAIFFRKKAEPVTIFSQPLRESAFLRGAKDDVVGRRSPLTTTLPERTTRRRSRVPSLGVRFPTA
jgi:hypothetical protein